MNTIEQGTPKHPYKKEYLNKGMHLSIRIYPCKKEYLNKSIHLNKGMYLNK